MSLGRYKTDTVRRWYCQLNEWQWPNDCPWKVPAKMDSDDSDFKWAWNRVVRELAWRNVRNYYTNVFDKQKRKQRRK